MGRYSKECSGVTCRLLLTAGVCDQRLGKLLRLLPTAGVGDQCLGAPFRLLPTAGVCDQHLGAVLRLLLTASIWCQGCFFILHHWANQFSVERENLGAWAIFKGYWHNQVVQKWVEGPIDG